MPKKNELEKFAIECIADGRDGALARLMADRFGVSRSYANRILRGLVDTGAVQASGSTRGRKYSLVERIRGQWKLELEGLDENVVWRTRVAPLLEGVRGNVMLICQTGLTEMVNNAIDHSEGTTCTVTLADTAADIHLTVRDDGVGIFKKLRDCFDLEDERHAALELAKGKLTTDPDRHTGEGIFFTSRMFDDFAIDSGGYSYAHSSSDPEWVFEETERLGGTSVHMRIRRASRHTVQQAYDQYAGPEDYGFNVTHVPVRLSIYGQENLVSRSQARRLLSRVQKFEHVVLDFDGVEMIGQAFADEVFRVFALAYPGIELRPHRASRRVSAVIRRATAARQASEAD